MGLDNAANLFSMFHDAFSSPSGMQEKMKNKEKRNLPL